MSDIDPAAVMAAHEDHLGGDESQCVAVQFAVVAYEVEWDEHCAAYLTAEALAAEQAKVARVEALPDLWESLTEEGQCQARDHWRGRDYIEGYDYRAETCAEELRAALADQPEQG